MADTVVFGNLTGASMNPGRTSPDGWRGLRPVWQFPIYVVSPIVGALAAAGLYGHISTAAARKETQLVLKTRERPA